MDQKVKSMCHAMLTQDSGPESSKSQMLWLASIISALLLGDAGRSQVKPCLSFSKSGMHRAVESNETILQQAGEPRCFLTPTHMCHGTGVPHSHICTLLIIKKNESVSGGGKERNHGSPDNLKEQKSCRCFRN